MVSRFLNSFTVGSIAIVLMVSGLTASMWSRAGDRSYSSVPALRPVTRELHKARTDWADESACVDCHEQATHFWETGHARTLTRATDDELLRKLLTLNTSQYKDDGVTVESTQNGLFISKTDPGKITTASVDWCFGSGMHANTWVTLLSDSLGSVDILELRWTHFTGAGEFGLTPGHPDTSGMTASARLGLLFDGPRARRCFSCHASMPDDNLDLSDFDAIHPGVTCQRCHGSRAEHVASEGMLNNASVGTMHRDASFTMCAECHRRAEDQLAEAVRPDNVDIVRFQPVGLSKSKCFVGTEMSCVSCHDPHRPLRMQDSLGDWQCRQCHNPNAMDANASAGKASRSFDVVSSGPHSSSVRHSSDSGRDCSAGEDKNCVSCHMPKVSTAPGLEFTDHWIRIRHEGQKPE